VNNSAGTDPTTFRPDRGYVRPDSVWQFGGDYQLTSNMIVTGRYGYWYQNFKDRGLPVGTRHLVSNGSKVTTGFDGTPIPTAFQLSPGFSDIGSNTAYLYDNNVRKSMSYDVSYFKSGFLGTHNLKIGYSNNKLANNVNQGYNTSLTQLYY